jgi:hypothetical protein
MIGAHLKIIANTIKILDEGNDNLHYSFESIDEVMTAESSSSSEDSRLFYASNCKRLSASYDKMHAEIKRISQQHKKMLVALMRMGRGDYSINEWKKALASTNAYTDEQLDTYILTTPYFCIYLRAGLLMHKLSIDKLTN